MGKHPNLYLQAMIIRLWTIQAWKKARSKYGKDKLEREIVKKSPLK